jgi:signal transduction histidine kinase
VDRDRWEHIVLNLLSNALKFTFVGEIGVTLGARDRQVVLDVHDTGIGIPAHELPHLFERFYRVQGADARVREGAGIGLALVHELAKLHGGAVGVSSVAGQGSTFSVTIPLGSAHLPVDRIAAAPDPRRVSQAATYADDVERWLPVPPDRPRLVAAGGSTPEPESPAGSPAGDAALERSARLLVIDDDADLRAYVARLLRGHGTVETAGDGLSALEIARVWKPDLILGDVMMPGLDGFALVEAIRADPCLRSTPVILLSARAGDENRAAGVRAGADGYLTKPFSVEELLARVDGLLKLARIRNEASTTAERERLALNLHDSVTQSVYSLTLLAEAGRRAVSRGDQVQAEDLLGRLSETAQGTLREMRLLVNQLRPASLAELGLVRAIEHRLDAVERRAGLTARFVVSGEITLSRVAEDAFYYIAQEALNNALKHADASEVMVSIAASSRGTRLAVADNGGGFDPAVASGTGGLGLVSMRQRAEGIGASLSIGRGVRGGTRVTVWLKPGGQRAVPRPEDAVREGGGWPGRSAS